MSYAPYPAYKDSGVPWLGNIPEHWDWAKLYLLSKRYAGGTPDKNVPEYWENGTIPWLNSGSVNQFDIDTPSAFITEEAYKNSSAKWVPEGALLMALAGQGKTKGMVAQTTFDTTCNQSLAAIVWKRANPRFMLWWLNSQYLNIRGLASSDARDGLNLEMLARIPCPLPSKEEQTAIADFLDKKTAEIDDLITKKEVLLRLLAEQRTALITHAVTKGLNPNAPMKPSGIDWLGNVPDGWEVKPLKYLGRFQNGISIGGDSFGSGFPFVSYGDVYKNFSLPETGSGLVESTAKDRVLYSVERGDIFFTRTSETIEEIAISSVCETTIPDAVFAGFLIRCRPYPKRLDVGFSKYYFRNSRLRDYFVKEMNLVTRASLGQTLLGNLTVALPPLDEQNRIAVFLDEKLGNLARVEADARKAIGLLKEYRTSIITSAVTGKIKVA